MSQSIEWEVRTTHPDREKPAIHYRGVHESWARFCYADIESRLVKGATVTLLNGSRVVSSFKHKDT